MKLRCTIPDALAHDHGLTEPTGKGEKNEHTFCPTCHGFFVRLTPGLRHNLELEMAITSKSWTDSGESN